MRRWISALVVAAFTALVALLGVPVPSAIAVPSAQPFPAYTYDGHDRSALSTTSTPARGPPAAYDHFTSDDAVDRPSHSASARPNRTMASPAIGYDHPTALVRGARATDMTQEHAQLSDGPSVVFDLVGVAANSVRSAAPSTFTRAEALSGRGSSRAVDNYAASMRSNGWEGIAPIDVVELQGSRIVVDGHHRLAAARRVGIDVQYRVVDPASVIGPGRYSSIDDILRATCSVGRDNLR